MGGVGGADHPFNGGLNSGTLRGSSCGENCPSCPRPLYSKWDQPTHALVCWRSGQKKKQKTEVEGKPSLGHDLSSLESAVLFTHTLSLWLSLLVLQPHPTPTLGTGFLSPASQAGSSSGTHFPARSQSSSLRWPFWVGLLGMVNR